MKNSIKNISNLRSSKILLSVFLLIVGSCDKYLDVVPDNRVALDDLDKAAQLLTNAYSTASYAFTDWMTDQAGYTRGVTIRLEQQQAYEWEDYTGDPEQLDTPDFFWFQTYNAIAHANEVLSIIHKLPTTEDDYVYRNSILAEAYLTRAYGHFMLVNLFAKHYDKLRAGSDKGVPYVTTPETVFIEQYSRNSVKEVYDLVEEDMLKGIELVNDGFFSNSGKYHFNRNAALAFASRYYLFKGEYDKCIEYSSQLLGGDPSAFVRDLTSEEFQTAKSSVQGYPQLYSSPDLPSNLMLMRKLSLVQRPDFAHGFTRNLYNDLFDLNFFGGTVDERENPAFVKGDNGLLPVRYQSLFERSSLNSNVGLPYHIAIAFRGEEVLFNRVEALVEENRLDEAINDLQVFVDRRFSGGSTELSIQFIRERLGVDGNQFFSDKQAVSVFVEIEKQKEFVIQGLRWFDIKRQELEVTHDDISGSTFTLTKKDKRKVLQIPTAAIEVGGLKPNPR